MSADPAPLPARARPLSSGVVRPRVARWPERLAARLIWLTTRLVALTLRWRMEDRSGFAQHGSRPRAIFAVWHNRLALSLVIYQRFFESTDRTSATGLAALVSASRDGGMLARVLELFRVQPVRGSSSRRGPQALRELITAASDGRDLAITPDGPRGPCYVVQEGVIAAAQLTGLPIVPVSYRLPWKLTLRSWDRFQVPLPFGRCEIVTGPALQIPSELTDPERERYRQELEATLRRLTLD